MREKCGVLGIYSRSEQVVSELIEGLYALQHRGQESCGIYVYAGNRVLGYKALGLVQDVFGDKDGPITDVKSRAGIGHVRYSTTAKSTIAEAQPFYLEYNNYSFALAFNGTITNFLELRRALKNKGYSFMTDTDTEVLAYLILDNLKRSGDYISALSEALAKINGACSMVLINNFGELYALRDPLGFKPVCIGATDSSVIIASESVALDVFDGRVIRDIRPGEIVKVADGDIEYWQIINSPHHALCMFEFVYFARPDSIINGINVYEARYKLGRNLAREHGVDADIVVPVPDSGRTAAYGFADESGIPLVEGLIKNRYVWRTFITPGQKNREFLVKLKLNVIKKLIAGKRVALIDDSIVRGTTIKRIVGLLKKGGAKEVHVRISAPPIIASCYMGIDFPTRRELIASNKSVEEIAVAIGADSLAYQSLDGLIKGIGLRENELCLACLTGKYPIKSLNAELLEAKLSSRI